MKLRYDRSRLLKEATIVSAPSYQDVLRNESEQDADESKKTGVVTIIALCLSFAALGFTLGTVVTQHRYNSVIAEYQVALDEAARAVSRANDMLSLPTPRPITPCVGKLCQTPPAPPKGYYKPAPAPTTAPESTPPPMISVPVPTVGPSATAYGW